MSRPSIPAPAHPTYDIAKVIQAALEEDSAGIGDVTTLATIDEHTQATATFLAKAQGTLAGLAVAQQVFHTVDPSLQVQWRAADGDVIAAGVEFGSVVGSARSILVAERVALNFMQRMSGIATATAAMVAAVAGHPAKILETRKTVPGLRLCDKWAVLIGGGANHRMGLFDMIMIKDNHAAAAGGISQAIDRAGAYVAAHPELGPLPVEVETRTLDEVREALAAIDAGRAPHVTRLMLDNMTPKDASCAGGVDVSMLREAVALIAGRVETEASGNVTLESAGAIASTGVTFISCGALTHSVKALDISLNIVTGQGPQHGQQLR